MADARLTDLESERGDSAREKCRQEDMRKATVLLESS